MRIKCFVPIVMECGQPHTLNDTSLVIDAQNLFYDCYQDSRLHCEFGAECDKYANFLKSFLSMFKKANVKCYFIFKGGTLKIKEKIVRDLNLESGHRDRMRQRGTKKYNPIFANNIHLQVLQEMQLDYVFSEFESKHDCVALAKKLSCAVLSHDIEFMFSGVPHISKKSLKFDEDKNILHCELITWDSFFKKYNLDIDKFAVFILLTDEKMFNAGTFCRLFENMNIQSSKAYTRNKNLLRWLSRRFSSEEKVIKNIVSSSNISLDRITAELNKAKALLRGNVRHGLAINYFFRTEFWDAAKWFECGLASNNIAKPYVDIYRSDTLFMQVEEDETFIHLSLPIIHYAYDLLTDFKNDGMKFILINFCSNRRYSEVVQRSVTKPTYDTNLSVFENGWSDKLRELGLFQHFITNQICFDFDTLERVPADAKMLMMALAYFAHKKCDNNTTHSISLTAYSILLCYVMLGVVYGDVGKAEGSNKNNGICARDCESAIELMDEYFKAEDKDMNTRLLNPLIEFQYCLREMNYLNKLCGTPFEPTIYRKTFNGTFVYNTIYRMQNESILTVKNIFQSVPTVSVFFNNIIDIYDKLIP